MKLTRKELQLLIQCSPGPIVIYLVKDEKSAPRPFLYSSSVPAFSGLTEEEYLQQYSEDAEKIVVQQDLPILKKTLEQSFAEHNTGTCTYRTYHKTKGSIWTQASFIWIGEYEDKQVLLGTFTDLSNQMGENTPGGFFIYAAEDDDQFFFVNENMLQMLGYRRDEFQSKFKNQFRYMIYKEDREETLKSIDCQIRENGHYDNVEYRIERKDGTLIWVHDEGHYVIDEDGRPWFYVTISDMSRILAENSKLQQANLELGTIIDSIPVGICVFKLNQGRMMQVNSNETFRRILHVTVEELNEYTQDLIARNVHPDDLDAIIQDVKAMQSIGMHVSGPFRYSATGQDWQWLRIEAKTVGMPDQTILVYSAITDLTAEKRADAKLQQAHRLQLEQYESSLNALLFANPQSLCTVRMNLSRNVCEKWYGTSSFVIKTIKSDTAEGVINNISKIILNDQERKKFREHFEPAALLDGYRHGRSNDSVRYRRIVEDGTFIWVKTVVNMVENPDTHDIEAVLFSENINDQIMDEEIIQKSTDSGYDYIATLHLSDQMYQFTYIGNQADDTYRIMQKELRHPVPYQTIVDYAQKNWYAPDEKEHFLKEVAVDSIVEHLEKKDSYTITLKYDLPEPGDGWKQIRITWLDDTREWILITQTDVTDSIHIQQEQLMERLNTERALRYEADKANESKSNFISNVSHDMRTPLNAILGYDRLALEEQSPEVRENYLKKIGEAGNTLLSLINDTLDLQKIETGITTLHPKPVSCGKVVDGIITAVKPMMDAKKIHFTFDNSKAVWATINIDEMRVEEIFINLLSNAAKFTPEGGEVLMAVECEKETPTEIYDKLIIKDNGAGISESFLPKIYEPFTQERNEKTAGIGGSGLGLSIVKRLVDLMHGRIEVKSRLNEGTEFDVYLTLPKATGAADTAGDMQQSEPMVLQGKKVLLCEDNEMNREIAKAILEKNGIAVVSAVNGREGAETFAKSDVGEISAILMDIRMPIMDGYEASRKIRESNHPDAKRVPIIALSADAYRKDIQKAADCGMSNFLPKPINPEQMISMLNSEILKADAGNQSKADTESD